MAETPQPPEQWPAIEWECWFRTEVKAADPKTALDVAERGIAARTSLGNVHRQAQLAPKAGRPFVKALRACLPPRWRTHRPSWLGRVRMQGPDDRGVIGIVLKHRLPVGHAPNPRTVLMQVCATASWRLNHGSDTLAILFPVDRVSPALFAHALGRVHDAFEAAARDAKASAPASERGGLP